MLIYHSENPRALKNCAKSTLPVLYKWNNKAYMTACLLTRWFTNYLNTTVEIYCSGNDSFQNITAHWQCTGHPRALMKMYKINVVFMLANTTPILKPVDQGVLLSFKSYYLRNTFHKVIAAMDSDSSDGSWKSQWKTSWKGFTILDAIKNIHGGLPWWRSGWESACQCRAHGFEPWSGKIPHAMEQLGL